MAHIYTFMDVDTNIQTKRSTNLVYENTTAFIIVTSIHKSQHIHAGHFGYNANILSLHLLKLH